MQTNRTPCRKGIFDEEIPRDRCRIIQLAKPSLDFDVSNAGTLKFPRAKKCCMMSVSDFISLFHAHVCFRPTPMVQAYTMREPKEFEEIGMYEKDESLRELNDPVWNSPLGYEVLRPGMARRLLKPTAKDTAINSIVDLSILEVL